MLRKTKITNSILKQSSRSTENDLTMGEILGWCVYSKYQYIICFYQNRVSYFPLFKELIKREAPKDGSNMEWRVEVKLGGNFVSWYYYDNNESDADKFIELLNGVKEKAKSLGQFYI